MFSIEAGVVRHIRNLMIDLENFINTTWNPRTCVLQGGPSGCKK
jgi:hypothetical protein